MAPGDHLELALATGIDEDTAGESLFEGVDGVVGVLELGLEVLDLLLEAGGGRRGFWPWRLGRQGGGRLSAHGVEVLSAAPGAAGDVGGGGVPVAGVEESDVMEAERRHRGGAGQHVEVEIGVVFPGVIPPGRGEVRCSAVG
jgi:hypothetical protein